jgi:hypothetical protein
MEATYRPHATNIAIGVPAIYVILQKIILLAYFITYSKNNLNTLRQTAITESILFS